MSFSPADRSLVALVSAMTLLSSCGYQGSEAGPNSAAVTNADCHASPLASGDAAAVVAKALAFKATLGNDQIALAELPFTRENAVRWSNLPVAAVPRVGIKFAIMTPAQDVAAQDLIHAAVSACGVKMIDEIRLADEYIKPIIPFYGWGGDTYSVGFLGTPSTTTPWMLKVGGHHLALNLTFNAKFPGATPQFNGIEPMQFSFKGESHEPMRAQGRAMAALAQGVASYPEAQLAGIFSDIVKGVEARIEPGPRLVGGYDTAFPSAYPTGSTGRGVNFLKLSKPQRRLVLAAIQSYIELNANELAKPLFAIYTRSPALAETYVGFSGSPDLSTAGSYVRIDGPRLWIELVLQAGVAYPEQLHIHAIWRDKLADYGGEFNR
jgi:hypothetical protein